MKIKTMPITIVTPEQIQEKAQSIAEVKCLKFKQELETLINWEIAHSETAETLNALTRLKRRAKAAWLHANTQQSCA